MNWLAPSDPLLAMYVSLGYQLPRRKKKQESSQKEPDVYIHTSWGRHSISIRRTPCFEFRLEGTPSLKELTV